MKIKCFLTFLHIVTYRENDIYMAHWDTQKKVPEVRGEWSKGFSLSSSDSASLSAEGSIVWYLCTTAGY